jgi:cytoskeleton protein RodZ
MSVKVEKNKNKPLLDKELLGDKSVSEAINEAFDSVELSTIGQLCHEARVNKSLTQEQASAILKVRVKIIKDFENGNQIDLPGLAYKVGFVRSYARLLGLDSDLLVKEFKESLKLSSYKEEYKFLTPNIEHKKILPIGAVLSLFISLIIYTGWYYSDRNNNVNQVSNQVLENENKTLPNLAENKYIIIEDSFEFNKSMSSDFKKNSDEVKKNVLNTQIGVKDDKFPINEGITLTDKIRIEQNEAETNEMSAKANERDPSTEMVLKAIGNSWVEIEDIDGNILMTRLMRPGETYVVPNITGLTFNTGNAGALSLSQGDILVPSLGNVGEIIKARPLNIKAFSN